MGPMSNAWKSIPVPPVATPTMAVQRAGTTEMDRIQSKVVGDFRQFDQTRTASMGAETAAAAIHPECALGARKPTAMHETGPRIA
jgi:hypothetical protein